jgi:hypothetical protein
MGSMRPSAILAALLLVVGCDLTPDDSPDVVLDTAEAELSTCATVAPTCPSGTAPSGGACVAVPACLDARYPTYRTDAYATSYDLCVKLNRPCSSTRDLNCQTPTCASGAWSIVPYARDACAGATPSAPVCPAGTAPRPDGRCVATSQCCGDGVCAAGEGETSTTCYADCPLPVCGNGACEAGEASGCPADCPDTCSGLAACPRGSRALFAYTQDVAAICGAHAACVGGTSTCVKAGASYVAACADLGALYQFCSTSWYVDPWSAYAGCQ